MRFGQVILAIIYVFLLQGYAANAQERKRVNAHRFGARPVVDGFLHEADWSLAGPAQGFCQYEPFNGRAASFETTVLVGYDDEAIYVAARIHDPHPDSLSLELHERDNTGLADYFGVMIDPYNDGLNALAFTVTARGVQSDMKFNNEDDDEDDSWDAVWKSGVQLTDDGWQVEMALPYAALRFPERAVQQWGINFFRSVQRKREYDSWNWVDVNKKGMTTQMGLLTIGEPIQPPLRLSFTPYLSATASHFSGTGKWSQGYNYGMDVKWGLNESFTLDLTLIPDFGQVESDELVYSLTPFEVYYDEKRPFFTEGTELFNKGNVFYTRRIGAKPRGWSNINSNYPDSLILSNPETVQLINAAKLSGKTAGGLGVGVFNAVTANTWAEVMTNGKTKRLRTEPWTNYNMIVLEQSLAHHSQLSFFNTNVARPDSNSMVNVSGAEVSLRNSKGSRQLYAQFNMSQHYQKGQETRLGERMQLYYGKIDGKFKPSAGVTLTTDSYNPNDMGYLKNPNEMVVNLEAEYNRYEPRGKVLRWYNEFYINPYYQYKPFKFSMLELGARTRLTTVAQYTLGGYFNFYPTGRLDFFEARSPGRYWQKPWSYNIGFWGSPDYRKTILADYRFGIRQYPEWKYFNWYVELSPRWRIQEHILLIAKVLYDYTINDRGFATHESTNGINEVIFGGRDVRNVISSIDLGYAFGPKSGMNLEMRHYWLLVGYDRYFRLLEDANLEPVEHHTDHSFAVNTFNIDMVYRWNFAPGSELLLVWKNAVYQQVAGNEMHDDYFRNLEQTFNSPMGNSFSIKLLYYLDWQQMRRVF